MVDEPYDERAEVLTVGLGNLICGLAGGLPATATISRTSLNVRKGATGHASALINGIAVLCIARMGVSAAAGAVLPWASPPARRGGHSSTSRCRSSPR